MSNYWNDQMKKSVEKRATQKSSGSSGGTSADSSIQTENYWKKILGTGTSLNIDGVSRWLADVSRTTDELEAYRTSHGSRFTKNYGGQSASKIKELLAASSDVQTFLDMHRDEICD